VAVWLFPRHKKSPAKYATRQLSWREISTLYEDGKVVHEKCYVQRLVSAQNDPPDPHHTE